MHWSERDVFAPGNRRAYEQEKKFTKTEKQWEKLGFKPKAGAEPFWEFVDFYGNVKTRYWHEQDVEPIGEE